MHTPWKIALCLLPLAVLSACSDEKDSPSPPVAETDETRYLRISIVSNNGTDSRADFESGTDSENKVNTLDFYFYDARKEYVSYVHVTSFEDDNTSVKGENVEKIITSVVPVELVQGARIPNYVIVTVNAVSPATHIDKNMAQAQADILTSIYQDNGTGTGFGMSNSAYYGYDNVSATRNTLITATPFNTKVLKTKAEMDRLVSDASSAADKASPAIKALEDITVNCYVERYAAKVELRGTSDSKSLNVEDYVSGGITLRFIPEGWAFNNFEKSFYFIKSFRQSESSQPGDFSSLSQINSALKWAWNDETQFRSYWSHTPAYYTREYPLVADDITDQLGKNDAYNPYSEMSGYPYKVFYHSYNSFKSFRNDIGKVGYFSESTVGADVLTGKNMDSRHNPLAAIPSVIVVGHYDVIVDGSKVLAGTDSPTFYTYGTNADDKMVIYTAEADKGGAPIGDAHSLLTRLLGDQKVIYYKESETSEPVYNLSTIPALRDEFSIGHPSASAREGMKTASRIVTLQHTQTSNPKLYFHDPEDPSADKTLSTQQNIDRANRLLFETLGGASAFHHGRAFFSAPVQHYGWHRADNPNKGKEQVEWDWSKMQAGDFGVVRNHKYTLSVNKISGIGTGILDYDTPILPPSEKVTYNMNFSISIQKWALMPVQKIDW